MSDREHYLPRGLGNFKGDERLADKICTDCQGLCGKLEDVMLHNGTEAFFRGMVGRVGRQGHRAKNIFYEPTHGLPPLTITSKHPNGGPETLWELVNEHECRPLNQIVIVGETGTLRMPYRAGTFSLEKIREQIAHEGIGELKDLLIVSADEAVTGELVALAKELLPSGKEQDLAPFQDGVLMEGEMRAGVSLDYTRALAKVGFHFFLQYFPQFTGFEPEFNEIKRYIYSGESDKERVKPTPEQFVLNLRNATLKQWGHFLSAQADESGIEARLQFFAGPPVQPIIWRIEIGKNPSNISLGVCQAFIYYDDLDGEYQGERHDLLPVGPEGNS